ncbi:hypothetical protein COW36_13830 [bacterium (Candidatus Blackallbacteria) CG17_big_fil_post_rev_8_21_14_2_50_48_46]|uniref:Uncharacterized protein n=1 Tax=bacterium (Candidatus Blackallbacteria) CG17_big_fil_post_rev_8_21_14_2_50_48_46 TaxID=2014261 RepID=A0A2M7G3D1_9BACT|nr:MAG: hypothetical protein COW64_23305 [bacterium (Candidatus Blackallbacteria) CG18_big_fil_WC_8_21_14_2_50_49_26]PIW16207.1 MAG: hypothetical protein COW36_13830 [bacterium (Candidatus Blackallbacteria) CG17_big_fil_post_rev_8_21_14_2_50_48_46]PIW49910.1 MAG: hypothetical protein COW20_04475 [bacterium (Candidatus Blackallbacteria) CG13_big_fil_rev_8_21_14_2_50_49_14]
MAFTEKNAALETQIQALEPEILALHASPWHGVLEEVGTGGWIQTLLQTVSGASQTLWAGRCSYAKEIQVTFYGEQSRSIAQSTVESWARKNLSTADKFFSLAISGAVRSGMAQGDCHAWLALALSDGRGWTLHLRLKQAERLEQQFALGVLGVHLLAQLAQEDGLVLETLEIPVGLELDVWLAWHESPFQTYLQAGQLMQKQPHGLLLFLPQAGRLLPMRPLEFLRGKNILLHKGSFNPVTLAHLAMPQAVLSEQPELLPVLEISLNNADKGTAALDNLAHRLSMLAFQNWPVALTRTPALYQTAELFRAEGQITQLDFVCGEDLYYRVFEPRYYQSLSGGLSEGLERLFAEGTQLWVCGRKNSLGFGPEAAQAAETWKEHCHFLAFDQPIASTQIREALQTGQSGWQKSVLPEVAEYLQNHPLYA